MTSFQTAVDLLALAPLAATEAIFMTKRPQMGPIVLDCTITETHIRTWQISQAPVESGSVLTDNVIRDPRMVTIEGVISPSPDNLIDQFRNIGARQATLKYAPHDKYQTSWARIQALNKVPYEPFTVYTAIEEYENMLMISLEEIEDGTDILRFTADLIEVQEVSIRRDKFISPGLGDRGANKIDLGATASDAFDAAFDTVAKFTDSIFGAAA